MGYIYETKTVLMSLFILIKMKPIEFQISFWIELSESERNATIVTV
jgi:hypothetical protein